MIEILTRPLPRWLFVTALFVTLVVSFAAIAFRIHADRTDAAITEANRVADVAYARAKAVHVAFDSVTRVSASRSAEITRLRAVADARGRAVAVLEDSIQHIATPASSDSTNPAWQRLYTLRTQQFDDLKLQLDTTTIALDSALADRDGWKHVATGALSATDSLKHALDLARSLPKGDRCRFLALFPCPSRTHAAIGAAVVTYIIATHPQQTRDAVHWVASPILRH